MSRTTSLTSAGFRQPHKVNQVQTKPATVQWDGLDSTELVAPFAQAPRVFHQIRVSNRTSAALYLTSPAFAKTVFTRSRVFDHNSLEVYDITLGSGGGRIGYFFRSPLRLKADPYFMLFTRRNIDPIADIVKSPAPAEKRYVLEKQVIIHVHDQGYMLTRVEDNAIATMLATQ